MSKEMDNSPMSKHTPGPWIAEERQFASYVISHEGRSLAAVWPTAGNGDELPIAANARLIAAAPDMYEALKGLCEALGDELNDATSEVWGKAAAALTKATNDQTES